MSSGQDTTGDCDDCKKVEIEKRLDAEESVKAFGRELEKLKDEHEYESGKLEKEQEHEFAKLAKERDNEAAKLDKEHELGTAKLDKEHTNALDTAEDDAATALQKARWETEFGLTKLFHEKVSEVAAGSVERSRDSAKYVQTAAAWIATLYGAVLAFVFSLADNPLPLRGVYAAAFLGLAVALATAYLAFITSGGKVKLYDGGGSLTEQQLNRTGFFVTWVNATVRDRRWAIRASVICLALGVAFIPAPFVANSRPAPIPETPTAPTIPGTIADQVSDTAVELFKAQLGSYKAALEARNNAISSQPTEKDSIAADEAKSNEIALILALVGLAVAFLGPLAYGCLADRDDREEAAATA